MANLGNAWHIPGAADPGPRGRAGMRDPIGAVVSGSAVTIFTGNQFQGDGNPGNQLQDGSLLSLKRNTDTEWTRPPLPLTFNSIVGNNKYSSATIPKDTFQVGDIVQYYLTIAYSDHDTTYLKASGGGATSVATANETDARCAPFTFTVEPSSQWGLWEPVLPLPNVAIHAHLLPTGLVLIWGRRERGPSAERPENSPTDQPLDVHECRPFLWDPLMKPIPDIKPSTLKVNLFCSGHAFLPDGRLLVAGGHCYDGEGLNQAMIYDPGDNTWTPAAVMEDGRWYPTATTLPDGSVLLVSGSYVDRPCPDQPPMNTPAMNNVIPEVWKNNNTWTELTQSPDPFNDPVHDLYPRVHVASDGRLLVTGPAAQTWSLEISKKSPWTPVALRKLGARDYAPSVMYDMDKIIYIGGGDPPTEKVEFIDLHEEPSPRWKGFDDGIKPMNFPRRHHNATILPDGTVLVTGGTRSAGFNDLDPGQPVHIAELWHPPTEDDPTTAYWTELAAEQVDRCYHSIAVLLPDATVLSAGGGEFYRTPGDRTTANFPLDSHRDAQIFRPPYLFKGTPPEITSFPNSVSYGEIFEVGTPQPSDIEKVTWIRLSSVTHAFNTSQRFIKLEHQVEAGSLKDTAPTSPNICPPGHYMLFILKQGVPSLAMIMQMKAPTGALAQAARKVSEPARGAKALDVFELREKVHNAARGTEVVVGITGTCPYGIAACWGSAHEALRSLEGVEYVDPIPDADNSTATVFLQDEQLPALDRWDEQFRRRVNRSYALRGFEVSLAGTIEARDGELLLAGSGRRPAVHLAPLAPADKVQWDRSAGTPKALESEETDAYARLVAESPNLTAGQPVTITGPLKQAAAGYQLEVRLFGG